MLPECSQVGKGEYTDPPGSLSPSDPNERLRRLQGMSHLFYKFVIII